LRDADGSALIVHANQDDHVSQPIGGAGARIACAVIK
jgi:Cu-Zn family superoxide dismutase